MPRKKIEMKKDILDKVLNDIHIPVYSKDIVNKNLEEDVDDCIKNILRPMFGNCVTGKKTGNKSIDNKIPAWHGETGSGKTDVMIILGIMKFH